MTQANLPAGRRMTVRGKARSATVAIKELAALAALGTGGQLSASGYDTLTKDLDADSATMP